MTPLDPPTLLNPHYQGLSTQNLPSKARSTPEEPTLPPCHPTAQIVRVPA